MTDFSFPVFKQEYVKFGDYHDWFASGAPKSAEYWTFANIEKGENYTGKHRRSPDGKYREGGAWLMVKRTYTTWGDTGDTYRLGAGLAYRGSYAYTDSFDWYAAGKVTPMTKEDYLSMVNSYGAQAYAALKPDTPDFTPVASLFELKDQAGHLHGRWRKLLLHISGKRGLGAYWLALNFGYIALFQDTLSFTKAFSNGNKKFQQLLRDEGKPVRRKRTLKKSGNNSDNPSVWNDISFGTAWHPNFHPVHVTQCYGGGVASEKSLETNYTKVWCAGRSRYVLPPGPRDDGWRNDMARRILGLRLTPSAVYNCIPWSWLFDYFTSLGSFMDAVSDGIADRVVFDYAYLMFEETYTLHQTGTQFVYTSPTSTGPVRSHRLMTETRKSRIAASPFGFGLKKADLSDRQLGILAALALQWNDL